MTRDLTRTLGRACIAIGAAGCAIIQGYLATDVGAGIGQVAFATSAAASAVVSIAATTAAIADGVASRRRP